MTDQTTVPCNAAQLHRLGDLLTTHAPHEWIVQPGMPAVRCPGAGDPPPAIPAGQAPATGQATPSQRAGLREALRRAVCEAEGFVWDSDMLEPDEYGDHADTVLTVLYREWPWLRAEAEDAAAVSAGPGQADDEARTELEQAQAAIERVRQVSAGLDRDATTPGVLEAVRPALRDAARQILAALDSAEQPAAGAQQPKEA